MAAPRNLRQQQFDAHHSGDCALDLDIKAREGLIPATILTVLIGIPRIPTAAQNPRLYWLMRCRRHGRRIIRGYASKREANAERENS
jgi:hypothetical protein